MPNWEFEKVSPAQVELEPTQRDQFNNDEVGLADALVREVIQNSTDAPAGDAPVKVRFAIFDLNASETAQLRELMHSLRPHLAACNIPTAPLDMSTGRILVVEDFNTTGLTGAIDTRDKGNFRNFWRRHGGSEKSGKSLGRWGLGKLVYSSSSAVHAFFGLTRRKNEDSALLLGQAVLLNHDLGSNRHPAHGFWFADRTPEGMQLPVSDPQIVGPFISLGDLNRDVPGLSIVVPYPLPGLTEDSLISAVVQNYYFPILAGRLEVEVGNTTLDAQSFLQIAGQHCANIPLDFVAEVSRSLLDDPSIVLLYDLKEEGVTEDQFDPNVLEALRDHFASGALVRVRAPVGLRKVDGSHTSSHVELFLQQATEIGQSYSLFARGSLTVTQEKKNFSGLPAFGAMIALDPAVAEFLGDAENPAHTSWNGHAEKVTAKWHQPYSVLRPIRASLRSLYQLIGGEVPKVHENLLLDFFSLMDAIPSKGSKAKKPPVPKPEIPRRERAMEISHRNGGFTITAGLGASSWKFPRVIRVRAAYDLAAGNPFKRHSKFDFDIGREIEIEACEAKVEAVSANALRVVLHSSEFVISATGFDVNRDLVVEARTVS